MKRFMFYPICKYDALDKKLADMEASGYCLDRVSPFWIFHFKPCKPRKVQYMTTYSYLKEFDSCGYSLLTKYEANLINGNPRIFSDRVSIHRIPKSDIDLSEKISYRNRYLCHVLWEKIQSILLYLVVFLAALSYIYPSATNIEIIAIIITNILISICLAWNLISLSFLRRKNTQSR